MRSIKVTSLLAWLSLLTTSYAQDVSGEKVHCTPSTRAT